MPPETKPIISKLEEMTCENCVYSGNNPVCEAERMCHKTTFPVEVLHTHFCSKGKWLTGRRYTSDLASELNLEDYDDAYYAIVRAQMFPDAVSMFEEYNVRQQILKLLDELYDVCVTNHIDSFQAVATQPLLVQIKDKLTKLWGEQ